MGQSLLGEVNFTFQAPLLSPPSKSCESPRVASGGNDPTAGGVSVDGKDTPEGRWRCWKLGV